MIAAVHIVVGAALASKTQNPFLGLFFAALSHYILDVVPHREYIESAKLPWKKPLHTFLMITCDLLAGFLIVYLLSGNKLLALAGGLAAIAPDFINGLYIFPRLTGTKLFKLERFIHADAAHFWDNKKIPLFWRIFSQALALSIA